jgi:hypothetical protein
MIWRLVIINSTVVKSKAGSMKMFKTFAQSIQRWKFILLTYRDYGSRLNRSVDVENALAECAAGKRPMLTRDECRQLALKLGVSQVSKPLKPKV